MSSKNLKRSKYLYITPIVVCMVLIIAIIYCTFFGSISRHSDTVYVYIDTDDTVDSVYNKVKEATGNRNIMGLSTLVRHSCYKDHIRTGRYAIRPGDSSFMLFRHLKNGHQSAMMLTIPSVRTKERLAGVLSGKLMLDSIALLDSLNSQAVCQQFSRDTTTIIGMFIPETYEVFWDTSVENLLERMSTESDRFWNDSRKAKAENLHFTQNDVITLASIIDEETANNAEKPMIAGMYYNRIQQDMPLQADPTIKFARKDFAARRIYRAWLTEDSPYNTYINKGLPPGPIRIPSVAGIDAVLNMAHHDYLYMCAKEDFSGTHNFATTYAEHLKNAARYTKALNERGIK